MYRSNTLISPSNLIFTTFFITIMSNYSIVSGAGDACSSGGPVVPTNPLVSFLERVQNRALDTFGPKGFDPKLYVDMPLKQNLTDAVKAFDQLPRKKNGSVSRMELEGFLKKYLGAAGEDLVYVVPADFKDEPEEFLLNVKSPSVRVWALEVHKLWKNLSRKVSDRVRAEPDRHTLLPLNHSVIIPGSRFREVYYWDSYWVIRGLLVSKMYETAKGIVYNLISLIDEYHHVLNGARRYYTNRSQPPLLSSMVIDIFNRTRDKELVKKALPALMTEHEFWTSGVHEVIVRDSKGVKHSLSRYYAKWNNPRPESSTIDKETASKLSNDSAKKLYREIASTAESGWDFSTRFMRNESDLATLATTSILPVDLNAFILKMELDIISLACAIQNTAVAEHYTNISVARKKSIDSIFWNEKTRQWHDYWLSHSDCSKGVYTWNASSQNQKIFASNFIPLWIKPFYSDVKKVDEVVKSLQKSTLIRQAGIATSLTRSGQQWDLPNGWAPLQHMIVEGLVRSGSKQAEKVAEDIAVKWLKTNYVTFKNTGAMHEKYDVEKCGGSGGGGEYVTQMGFGWSNGVVLAFLEEFGWPKDKRIDCKV